MKCLNGSHKEIQDDAKEKWDSSDIDMYIYITRKYYM